MNKKTTILATILFASASLFAQDVKKENETVKTKMDLFSSKTGTITKFVDTNLPNLKTAYGGAETKIRKIINGVNSAYFFQITNKGKYGSSTASIEYSDLIEVLKALKALQPEVEKDIATNPNYLENKFVTVDGFQVGYYVSGGKAVWYLKLEKYGSDNTLFIDNGTTIETAFSEAKNKIDYAIFKDGHPTILVECKDWRQNLNVHDGQLLRYFHVSKAKFGLLTNGIVYRFYSDLVAPNKMDEKPFLEFNITEIKDNQIEELKKFHKANFDAESIVNTASEMKYMNELKHLLHNELTEPSAEFVKYFAKQVYPSVVTAKVLEQFTLLTKNSIQHYISDLITERLKTALSKEDEKSKKESVTEITTEQNLEDISKINTTEEELEGFLIVKTILRQKIPATRVTYRDAQSYFAIFLDDNNRKAVCRLYLNGGKKFVGLLDENKKETKNEIQSLDDIFNYSAELLKTIEQYE